MRHLAIRQWSAGPATRASHLAPTVGILILFLLGPVAAGQTRQPDSWLLGDLPTSERGEWNRFGSPHSGSTSLSADLFGQPGYDAAAPLYLSTENSPVLPAQYLGDASFAASSASGSPGKEAWCHQVLPDGLIYRSYLAGVKESRFAGQWVHDVDLGWMWDITLGGRVGILRYGNTDPEHPEGWQLDMEGAGMPRLDLEHEDRDLIAADFRFGIPLTYGRGNYQTKLAYYHLSSHLGDEYMVRHATFQRINYSRDVLVWGNSYFLTDDVRFYGEVGWAFNYDGGTEPWEFQFGVDYSPARQTGQLGAPFMAINGHLRQEFDFGGNLVVQTGWQWRGTSGHLFRIGMHYFQGMSDQWELFDQFEDKLGFGIWYDF